MSLHPDVVNKKKTPEQAYREFMSLWDTQVADGIVTLDEFNEYFRDVSCSIDTDEYFAAMMKSAWKLWLKYYTCQLKFYILYQVCV